MRRRGRRMQVALSGARPKLFWRKSAPSHPPLGPLWIILPHRAKHHAWFRGVSLLLPPLYLAWISKKACFMLSSSGLVALVLDLVVEQLVLPAQILSDRGHALIPQQFL